MRGTGFRAITVASATIALAGASTAAAAGPLKLTRIGTQVGETQDTRSGFMARLILTTDKGTVGKARFRCRIPGDIADCTMKSRFSEGKIVARGPVEVGERYPSMPITGGTGLFTEARGELHFRRGAERPSFRLVYVLKRYG